jgi:hypothetical protein
MILRLRRWECASRERDVRFVFFSVDESEARSKWRVRSVFVVQILAVNNHDSSTFCPSMIIPLVGSDLSSDFDPTLWSIVPLVEYLHRRLFQEKDNCSTVGRR